MTSLLAMKESLPAGCKNLPQRKKARREAH
jgi:hypothetical protein